ncbi:NAD-binding protein [Lentzea sp. NPDC058450]|uniref:NAD-binding protein n=1 Tax=Lentzea sp. NPDC058450 TaxID=3346505 RepID=UPI00364ED004
MADYILVIGYGDAGHEAVNAVLEAQPDARLTVLDTDFVAVAEAAANGAVAVVGDGRDRCALDEASVDAADRVFITVPDDLASFLVMRAVRTMNPDAVIVVVIRDQENHGLFDSYDVTSVHIKRPPT